MVQGVLDQRKVIQEDDKANQERLLLPQCRDDITSIRHVNDVRRKKEQVARSRAYAKLQRDTEEERTKLIHMKQLHENLCSNGQRRTCDWMVIDHSTTGNAHARRPTTAPPSHASSLRSPIGNRQRTFRTAL